MDLNADDKKQLLIHNIKASYAISDLSSKFLVVKWPLIRPFHALVLQSYKFQPEKICETLVELFTGSSPCSGRSKNFEKRGRRKTIYQLCPHLSQMRTTKYLHWKSGFKNM